MSLSAQPIPAAKALASYTARWPNFEILRQLPLASFGEPETAPAATAAPIAQGPRVQANTLGINLGPKPDNEFLN